VRFLALRRYNIPLDYKKPPEVAKLNKIAVLIAGCYCYRVNRRADSSQQLSRTEQKKKKEAKKKKNLIYYYNI